MFEDRGKGTEWTVIDKGMDQPGMEKAVVKKG